MDYVVECCKKREDGYVEKAEALWVACAESLRSQVSEATWKTWFEGVRPLSRDANELVLAVPSAIVKERIEGRYANLVNDALIDAGEPQVGVRLLITTDEKEDETVIIDLTNSSVGVHQRPGTPLQLFNPESEYELPKKKRTQRVTDSPLNPSYTFENFVIGTSNRFAHAAALSVAETPAKSYNPLFIHGDAGLGKTHLLQAIGNYVTENFPNRYVRYVSTETFMNEFVDAIRTNATTAFKRRYRECDVLLVDDIQFMEHKEGLQEEFFHTFNHLYGANKQIVISSDRHAKALTTLEGRLRSRFLSGLITDVQPPDLETRMAILRKKSDGLRTTVPDKVHEFIAMNVTDNIRELEGALIRVSAFASLHGAEVTLPLAQEILSDILTVSNSPKTITPQQILTTTAEMFGFSVQELCGSSRRRPLVTARQIGMYVFRELTDFSYPAIAREFGGRDHTTIIYAVDKITELMFERGHIYDKVTELIHRLRNSG